MNRDIGRTICTALSFLFFAAQLFFTVYLGIEMLRVQGGPNFEGLAIIVLLPMSLIIGFVGALFSLIFASIARHRLNVNPPFSGEGLRRILVTLLQILPPIAYIAVEAYFILALQ